MRVAVLQKIEDRITDDVITSFRDPATATLAEIVARVRARWESLKNPDALEEAIKEAIDSVYAETSELFTLHQQVVPPRPR
jgi:hypothetical protein